MRRRPVLIAILALGLPGLMLAPVWRLGAVCAGEDDVLYYYPSRTWLHELFRTGQPPYLNPWTGLDRPLLADPQTALFYPTTWLFAPLPPATAYPASLWLHYSLAFFGAYRLLRASKLDVGPAIFGAAAFAYCGFMLAHRAHFTIQHAAAWLPLVLWRLDRFATQGGSARFVIAAIIAAMQCFSGHFQISALTALGTLVYLLAGIGGLSWHTVRAWAAAWLAAGLLFAVQLVPTLAHVAICNRGDRGILQFFENSWNPLSVIGLLMPMFFGQRTPNLFDAEYWGFSHQVEQFVYPSILVLFLALAAFRADWQSHPVRRPFGWLAIFAAVLALGQFTPAGPFFYLLPGASLFRVPARAMLLANLALAAISASVLADLARAPSPMHSRLRAALLRVTARPVAFPLAFAAGVVLLAFIVSWVLPEPWHSRALAAIRPWGAIVVLPILMMIGSLLLLRHAAAHWRRPPRVALLATVMLLDLGIIGWTIDVPRADDPRAAPAAPLDERWVRDVRTTGSRLWVVTGRSDGVPGEYIDARAKLAANTNILARVPSLTDYGPLMPRMYAAHFPFKPWGEAEPPVALPLLSDTTWMHDFDVGWVLLCEPAWPPPPLGLLHTTTAEGFRLYKMPPPRGRAYLDGTAGTVDVVQGLAANMRIHIARDPESTRRAAPPARLIIARLALPGWRAEIDGVAAPVENRNGLLAIALPDRPKLEIRLDYSPPGLTAGAMITAAAALGLALLVAVGRLSATRLPNPRRPRPTSSPLPAPAARRDDPPPAA